MHLIPFFLVLICLAISLVFLWRCDVANLRAHYGDVTRAQANHIAQLEQNLNDLRQRHGLPVLHGSLFTTAGGLQRHQEAVELTTPSPLVDPVSDEILDDDPLSYVRGHVRLQEEI